MAAGGLLGVGCAAVNSAAFGADMQVDLGGLGGLIDEFRSADGV